jgi:cellulose synthase/poly-beta-1,6-N-acetylglucosamine synthase-like glycosyltransferase
VALEIVFWVAAGLIVYAHAGYPLVLFVITRLWPTAPGRRLDRVATAWGGMGPAVSLIVAAYDEEAVIERRVANALALDYPRERLELIVASDGSRDRTAELARGAGADRVLELPRGGKVAALNAAVRESTGELLAFSDANSFWRPGALRRLVAPFADPGVGYVCGQVRFLDTRGENEEGLYWRYEMWVREMESRLGGVTAGNGAIYAVRREAYIELHPSRGHDLSLPFELTKRGWRAMYEPGALAEERMAPTIEGEFRRKRRMMWGLWDIMLHWGMLNPRGYSPAYALQVASHRLLRYLTPLFHLVALAANVALLGRGGIYVATLAVQVGLLAAAALGRFLPLRPLRIAYYYVAVTASVAAGLWDRLRAGTVPIGWEKVEGTR